MQAALPRDRLRPLQLEGLTACAARAPSMLAANRQPGGRQGLLREGCYWAGAPEVSLARGQEHGEGRCAVAGRRRRRTRRRSSHDALRWRLYATLKTFLAASCLLCPGDLAKETGDWESVSECYGRAAELFAEEGRLTNAAEAMARGARALEERRPEVHRLDGRPAGRALHLPAVAALQPQRYAPARGMHGPAGQHTGCGVAPPL